MNGWLIFLGLALLLGGGRQLKIGRSGCGSVLLGVILVLGGFSSSSDALKRRTATTPIALEATPQPTPKSQEELLAALADARQRYAARVDGSIYTMSDAAVLSYSRQGNHVRMRTRAVNGKISYVFHSCYRAALREHGFTVSFDTTYK